MMSLHCGLKIRLNGEAPKSVAVNFDMVDIEVRALVTRCRTCGIDRPEGFIKIVSQPDNKADTKIV
jgi:hypothetical protein